MRARRWMSLGLLVVCTLTGCSQPTMQGTPERLPGMILGESDMSSLLLSSPDLAERAGISVDDLVPIGQLDTKIDPDVRTEPVACNTYNIRTGVSADRPQVFGLVASATTEIDDLITGPEWIEAVAVLASPALARTKFEDLSNQLAPCSQFESIVDNTEPLIMALTADQVPGLTLESLVIQRKVVASANLIASGFGLTVLETYILFRNAIIKLQYRQYGVADIDRAAAESFVLATQQHLISLG